MIVDSVWRKFVDALGRIPTVDEECKSADSSRRWISFVTIAVWVTFMGIIVFFVGTLRTICAACAGNFVKKAPIVRNDSRDTYDHRGCYIPRQQNDYPFLRHLP